MIELALLREHPGLVEERLALRGFTETGLIDQLLEIDSHRRETLHSRENYQAQINKSSKLIGQLMSQGQQEEANQRKDDVAKLKAQLKESDHRLAELEKHQQEILLKIPNVPHQSVPKGAHAEHNEEVRSGGTEPSLVDPKPHWELGEGLGILNMELGTKVTGAGFPVFIGQGAALQRALISFFLDEAKAAGYKEHWVPLMVNAESGFGTGQLPDKEGQMYFLQQDDFYMVPTAEVPLTNLYRDVILKEEELPVKLTAYTPCFRREAGSYGKEVRGLNRVHQFDKVEIVQMVKAENSYSVLDKMVSYVEGIMNKLQLPYRIMKLCGGDLGFASAMTYDFEVWSAGQERWLEVSSVSNFETFQSNRMKIRYKGADGKTHLLHTLNGSALALPRIVAALMENNQTSTGIAVPEVLRGYTGFDEI